jgi:hypothetical protein
LIEKKENYRLDWSWHQDECGGCSRCHEWSDVWEKWQMTVLSPYYRAIENQHHSEVILVKQEVSNLKKEDFSK